MNSKLFAVVALAFAFSGANAADKPVAYPAWRKALVGKALMQPYEVTGTDYTVTMAPHQGNQLAFSGFANDDGPATAKCYTLAVGGHAVNNRNSVEVIDLMADQPTWKRIHEGSSDAVQQAAYSAHDPHHYSDGLPASAHTYFDCWMIRRFNILVRLRCTDTHPGAGGGLVCDVFDLTTKQWLPEGTFPSISNTSETVFSSHVATVTKHPLTEDLYYARGGDPQVWHAESNRSAKVTQLGSQQGWHYSGSCIRMVDGNEEWMFLGYFDDLWLASRDLKTGKYDRKRVTGAPSISGAQSAAVLWDADKDLIYWIRGGENGDHDEFWAVEPKTGAATKKFDLPQLGPGPYNRACYFPALKGIAIFPEGSPNNNMRFVPLK